MSKTQEALKLALEALEGCEDVTANVLKAITAIREALAEQPAQEPVAVVSGYYGGQCVILPIDPARIFNSNTALYTSPQPSKPWVGLTDEEKERIRNNWGLRTYKAIEDTETKLREKNA